MDVRVEFELFLTVDAGKDVRSSVDEYLKQHQNIPAQSLLRYLRITDVAVIPPWQQGQERQSNIWDSPDE